MGRVPICSRIFTQRTSTKPILLRRTIISVRLTSRISFRIGITTRIQSLTPILRGLEVEVGDKRSWHLTRLLYSTTVLLLKDQFLIWTKVLLSACSNHKCLEAFRLKTIMLCSLRGSKHRARRHAHATKSVSGTGFPRPYFGAPILCKRRLLSGPHLMDHK